MRNSTPAVNSASFSRARPDCLALTLTAASLKESAPPPPSFPAYGHEVTLAVSDLEWETTVYFAEPDDFPINVVGRIGFLDHLQVGLVDYEQLLYLNPYGTV